MPPLLSRPLSLFRYPIQHACAPASRSAGGPLLRRSWAQQLRQFSIVATLEQKIEKLAEQKKDQILSAKKSQTVVHEVTSDQVFGGMRGIPAMVTETSDLDPVKGITYRGYSLVEANEKLPKANADGRSGLPEAAWWLLLTGEMPTEGEVKDLQAEIFRRSAIPDHVLKTLDTVGAVFGGNKFI